jgi:histidyl-tRNA synthetase
LDRLLLGSGVGDADEFGGDASSELSTQQMLDVLLDATQRGVTMGGRTRNDIVRRLLEKRQRATERVQVAAALDFLEAWSAIRAAPDEAFAVIAGMIPPDDAQARAILDEWRQVIALLDAYGIPASRIEIQPALARSWDYYTGIVFELWSNGYHLGGGGRYDELTQLVGGDHAVPAVGFAYYVEPLLAALPDIQDQPPRVIAISASQDALPTAVRWAQALRELGQAVVLVNGAEHGRNALVAQADGTLLQGEHIYTSIETLIDDLERRP